jgi:uncharacterized membrane protein
MLYLCLKYLHVTAAIFLFGFGMGSYLYLVAANRSRSPEVIAHVAGMVVRYDTWITTPAGFLQLATGYWLFRLAGLSMASAWVSASIIVFFTVGALWLPVLVIQKRLMRMATQAANQGGSLDGSYRSQYQMWFWMGICGFAGMFLIVAMMVTKMTPWQWFTLFA